MRYHDIQLTGSLQITGSLTLPAGTTEERPTNPRSGSVRLNTTLGVMEIYTAALGSEWVTVGEQTTPVDASRDIEYLLVAGGGGGGGTYHAGGGGAGGLLSASLSTVQSGSSFTVTVGSGGSGGIGSLTDNDVGTVGSAGQDSVITGDSISTLTAIGGGGGGSYNKLQASAGGSGGGEPGNGNVTGLSTLGNYGVGTTGQGSDGGKTAGTTWSGGGGGGGHSTVGGNGQSNSSNNTGCVGGDGGEGTASNITGNSTFYSGGGGGAGAHQSGYTSNGGTGGGGRGSDTTGENGTENTGGGGGGAERGVATNGTTNPFNGGSGGSGVAIFAYDSGSINAVGGIVGDAGNGRKYNQFNASGTFKVGSTSDFGTVTDSLQINLDAGNFTSRGTSTWTDLQGNYNVTNNGATLGNNFYYSFDGSNDYMTIGAGAHSTYINPSQDYSSEAWIKLTGATTDYVCLMFANNAVDIVANVVRNNAGTVGAFCYHKYQTNGTYEPTFSDDAGWHHYVFSYASSGTMTIYRDGSELGNGSLDSRSAITSPTVSVGASTTYNGSRSYSTGNLAQLRYYSKALSASEVSQNYNATKTNFV